VGERQSKVPPFEPGYPKATSDESFWGKADKLKASVVNPIVPIWWQVKDDEQRSGWDDMTEFVKEALARAVKKRKRERAASGSQLHGSNAPTNSAVKKAKSGAPSETTMAEQNGNDTKDTAISPSKYAIDRMTQAIGDMGGAIRTQCAIMERQADSMTLTAEAAAKKAKIETLRLQLQIFPPGSVEYQNAYQELVDANRSVAQAADEAAEQDGNLRNL